jgi:hypothetical protein
MRRRAIVMLLVASGCTLDFDSVGPNEGGAPQAGAPSTGGSSQGGYAAGDQGAAPSTIGGAPSGGAPSGGDGGTSECGSSECVAIPPGFEGPLLLEALPGCDEDALIFRGGRKVGGQPILQQVSAGCGCSCTVSGTCPAVDVGFLSAGCTDGDPILSTSLDPMECSATGARAVRVQGQTGVVGCEPTATDVPALAFPEPFVHPFEACAPPVPTCDGGACLSPDRQWCIVTPSVETPCPPEFSVAVPFIRESAVDDTRMCGCECRSGACVPDFTGFGSSTMMCDPTMAFGLSPSVADMACFEANKPFAQLEYEPTPDCPSTGMPSQLGMIAGVPNLACCTN